MQFIVLCFAALTLEVAPSSWKASNAITLTFEDNNLVDDG